MVTLIGPPVREVPTERQLMVSENQVDIVGGLIRVRYDMRGIRSSAKAESTGHGDLHAAFGITEGFDAKIRGGKELHAGAADYGSIRRYTKGINDVGSDQISTAQCVRLGKVAVTAIVGGLQRQEESVCQRVRVRRFVARHNVPPEDGMSIALLIVGLADNLILVGFIRDRVNDLSALILGFRKFGRDDHRRSAVEGGIDAIVDEWLPQVDLPAGIASRRGESCPVAGHHRCCRNVAPWPPPGAGDFADFWRNTRRPSRSGTYGATAASWTK